MKRFMIVSAIMVVLLAPCFAAAPKDSKETYSETVNVPGVSAADLYMKVNLWCTDTFKGPPEPDYNVGFNIPWERSRITASDKNKGVIQASYTFFTDERINWTGIIIFIIYSNVEIQVSDGQYRLVFSKPRLAGGSYATGNSKWIYGKPVPLRPKPAQYVDVTKKMWLDLASALRETVGGTLAKDL